MSANKTGGHLCVSACSNAGRCKGDDLGGHLSDTVAGSSDT